MFANAIVAAALTFSAATGGPAGAPLEDEAGFDCATQGNHICGPGGEAPAGLYRDGVLVVPWTNYEHPEQDELYGVMPGNEYELTEQYGLHGAMELDPSSIQVSGASLAERLASLHVLDAQEIAVAKCSTDTDCARYALENGMGFDGESLGLPNGIVVDGYVTTDHGFEPVPFN